MFKFMPEIKITKITDLPQLLTMDLPGDYDSADSDYAPTPV